MSNRRIAVLAHEKFPSGAKTALGVMRYSDDETVAVIDRDTAGDRVADHETTVPDAPIVDSFEAVEGPVDALLIGIAPIGGGFDDSWRSDVIAALEQGVDVVAGLHYFLSEDEEFATLAAEHGAELHDVRKPHDGIGVAEGKSDEIDAEVVLTVGTDCSVGKMTATCELVDTAQEMGIDAGFIPTGQTGIMIAGWGNPVDRVVSDFTAGSVEEMLLEKGDEHDVLFVEGQGSIIHPAYSAVTCGILHGAMADKLVLCHEAGREVVHGYEDTALPPVSEYVDLYESLAAPVHETEVVGGAINTSGLDSDEQATAAIEAYADEVGGTATDPIRFGCAELVEELVGEYK